MRTALEPTLARLRGPVGEPPTPEAILDLKICDPAMGSGAFLVEACRQLGDALLDAWRAHDAAPAMAAGNDEVVVARRLIAQRCLYGVDRNPMAVDLAKVSLWLATLAKEHPLTFVDHALRHGDSLVGLTQRQIEAFHWEDGAEPLQQGIETLELRGCVARVAELRRRIREADETVSDWELRDWWDEARFELGKVRLFGDLVIAAFFAGSKPKERKAKRDEYAGAVFAGEFEGYREWIERRRGEDPPLAPFHWEIEFPEVFERARPAPGGPRSASFSEPAGFDAIVGNPPFLGGKRISTNLGDGYRDWLAAMHPGSNSNADLVAHFFRRVFDLVRQSGAFGLIATNTIAQGDTRASGLRWICQHGGEIYAARRRVPWPGHAAVIASVVHVRRAALGAPWRGPRALDGSPVERISAFLFHRGGHDNPVRLAAHAGKSFVGMFLRGMGFTFDDTDTNDAASPLSEMRRLIERDPRNQEAICPYIGGKEVNTSPTHAHHRYVINFRDWPLQRESVGVRDAIGGSSATDTASTPAESPGAGYRLPGTPATGGVYELRRTAGSSGDAGRRGTSWAEATDEQRRAWLRRGRVPLDYPEPVAADYPDLLQIVEERVKPVREQLGDSAIDRTHRARWWLYANDRPELRSAIAGLDRVLVNSQVSSRIQFAFLRPEMVFAHTANVFPFETYAAFCTLQARAHELWSFFFGSSMKDDLRYTPSDCFETFPCPAGWESADALEAAGQQYYEFRASLMVRRGEGLTKIYNRFHDPHENDAEVARLRELHAAMDRAVLRAYGWTDIPIDCEFLLDHKGHDEEGRGRKPYRYRWPEAVHDEVLARLLELNAQRAAERPPSGDAGQLAAGRLNRTRRVGAPAVARSRGADSAPVRGSEGPIPASRRTAGPPADPGCLEAVTPQRPRTSATNPYNEKQGRRVGRNKNRKQGA